VFTIPSVNTQDSVTGSQLAAAGVFGVNGFGDQFSPNDNQWFNISDTAGPIVSFTASSTINAFEFDMGSPVPEPSTWAMMMLGFVGLGYAAFRRSAKAHALVTEVSRSDGSAEGRLRAAFLFVPAESLSAGRVCGRPALSDRPRRAQNSAAKTPQTTIDGPGLDASEPLEPSGRQLELMENA
jgi:hypothetical protein